jgi:hypothetical protein
MHILFLLLVVPTIFIFVCYFWVEAIPLFRWLMFIPLLIIALALATLPFNHVNEAMEIVTIPLGITAAWVIASIPIYRQRYQDKQTRLQAEKAYQAAHDAVFNPKVVASGLEPWVSGSRSHPGRGSTALSGPSGRPNP